MTTTIFDVESASEPLEKIESLMPIFDAPKNYSDPEKIAANIAKQKADWLEKAALSAMTGKVLCIGILRGKKPFILESEDEAENLRAFWDIWQEPTGCWVGFNVKGWDFPFLIRRSWHLKVPIPNEVRVGRYWTSRIVDVMEAWQLGDHREYVSLDKACQFLGIGEKTGKGADFHKVWVQDREKAKEYLFNDLFLTQQLAHRLGAIREPLEIPF